MLVRRGVMVSDGGCADTKLSCRLGTCASCGDIALELRAMLSRIEPSCITGCTPLAAHAHCKHYLHRLPWDTILLVTSECDES